MCSVMYVFRALLTVERVAVLTERSDGLSHAASCATVRVSRERFGSVDRVESHPIPSSNRIESNRIHIRLNSRRFGRLINITCVMLCVGAKWLLVLCEDETGCGDVDGSMAEQ